MPSDQTTGKKIAPSAENAAPCYHCDQAHQTNQFCALWKVWHCAKCLVKHHLPHHPNCDLVIPHNLRDSYRRPRVFVINLTRYDGRKLYVTCRLGDKLRMEDHWMGTYIYASSGLILVLEKRATINERILQGLASTYVAPKGMTP